MAGKDKIVRFGPFPEVPSFSPSFNLTYSSIFIGYIFYEVRMLDEKVWLTVSASLLLKMCLMGLRAELCADQSMLCF